MTTISMPQKEFLALVSPVMPLVSRMSAIHGLEGVRIRTTGGHVIAEAVSATMAGMCVRPMVDAPEGFDLVFPINELPIGEGIYQRIGIEQTTRGTAIMEWSEGGTAIAEYDVLDARLFPDVGKKLLKALTVTERCGTANLSTEQLRAFAVAADGPNNLHHAPLVIHTGATVYDPILVTCGNHFAGLATAVPILEPQVRGMNHRKPQVNTLKPVEFWIDQLTTPEGE